MGVTCVILKGMMSSSVPSFEEIIAHKKKAIAQMQVVTPLASLRALASMQDRPQDVSSTIRENRTALLVQVRNPFASLPTDGGTIPPYDPVALARRLVRQGAHALVVTTSKQFHGGGVEHLTLVTNAVKVPVIREDYILDEYQVVETKAAGGDGMMLFMAILDENQRRILISVTQRNLMTVIAQVHTVEELESILPYEPRVIAISNADPQTGEVDLTTTSRLLELVPGHITVVTMGGITTTQDVATVMTGVDGVLVPQELMLVPDSAATIRQMLNITLAKHPDDGDPLATSTGW